MGQIIAYTQAELEQTGWVFDVEESPETVIPIATIYEDGRIVGDIKGVLNAAFHLLPSAKQAPFQLRIRASYGTDYLATQWYRQSENDFRFYTTFYEGDEARRIYVSVTEDGEFRSYKKDRPAEPEPLWAEITEGGVVLGNIKRVLAVAFGLDGAEHQPFQIWLQSLGGARYLVNQWYQISANEFRIYASYYQSGQVNRIRVSLTREGQINYYTVDS